MGHGSKTGPGGTCYALCGRLGDRRCSRCNTWYCQQCSPSHIHGTSRISGSSEKPEPRQPVLPGEIYTSTSERSRKRERRRRRKRQMSKLAESRRLAQGKEQP
jgi:hypothetical protein